MTKTSMRRNETGVQKLLGAAHLFELILDDGNCGSYHFDLSDLYLSCSEYTAWQGNLSIAMEYFDIGFEHKRSMTHYAVKVFITTQRHLYQKSHQTAINGCKFLWD